MLFPDKFSDAIFELSDVKFNNGLTRSIIKVSDDNYGLPGSVLTRKRIAELASYKRFINDVVFTVTMRKDIYVDFATVDKPQDNVIYISAKINETNVDKHVGDALHQCGHILYTEKELIDKLKIYKNHPSFKEETYVVDILSKLVDDPILLIEYFYELIEDLRIFNLLYDTLPMYRGYLLAAWNDRYFEDQFENVELCHAITSKPTTNAYLGAILNLGKNVTDFNRGYTELPMYDSLKMLVDVDNLSRLKTSKDSLSLACKVLGLVSSHIPKEFTLNNVLSSNSFPTEETDDIKEMMLLSFLSSLIELKERLIEAIKSGEFPEELAGMFKRSIPSHGGHSIGYNNSSFEVKNLMDKLISLEKEFKAVLDSKIADVLSDLNGNKLNSADKKYIDLVADARSSIDSVAFKEDNVCAVVRGYRKELLNSSVLEGMYDKQSGMSSMDAVLDGIALGRSLANRIRTLQEDKQTEFTRLKTGKLDRRLIYSIPLGNDNLFKTLQISTNKKHYIHVSIDASGSMNGDPWNAALKTAIAIASSCKPLRNMECSISLRGNDESGPVLWVIYDSIKDNIRTLYNIAMNTVPRSGTPEGLAMEPLIQEFESRNTSEYNKFFINVSDGEPYFNEYSGAPAFEHTKSVMDKFRANDVKILSYYVGNKQGRRNFVKMYGRDASFIDVNQLSDLAISFNKKLLNR